MALDELQRPQSCQSRAKAGQIHGSGVMSDPPQDVTTDVAIRLCSKGSGRVGTQK